MREDGSEPGREQRAQPIEAVADAGEREQHTEDARNCAVANHENPEQHAVERERHLPHVHRVGVKVEQRERRLRWSAQRRE